MKSKVALFVVIALVLALTLAVCGCATGSHGSYSAVGYSHSMSDKGATGTYSSFDGTRTYDKELKAGDTIKVTITTNSGIMTGMVTSADGTLVLSASEAGEYSCTVEADGKYTVTLIGATHSGGYTLEW